MKFIRLKLIYLEKLPNINISLHQLLPNILGNFSEFALFSIKKMFQTNIYRGEEIY